jgi:hypothetical protein
MRSLPFVLLSDSAHKSPADTPIAPCFPTRGLLFAVLVGLHFKWRDVVPFGYILHGAIGAIRLLENAP